jgi:transcriptional regulator with XRE-family HTH domain
MAKRKVRPQKGELSKLLKEKALTQMDAHAKTGVDRKTLLRIERGEEVKVETLERVATGLRTPLDRFLESSGTEIGDYDVDDLTASFFQPGDVTISKLNAERLRRLLIPASRIRWEINAQLNNDARKLLEEFEPAVESLRQNIQDEDDGSLHFQLQRLKTLEDIDSGLKQLAEHRLTLLAAEYLLWECSDDSYEGRTTIDYTSSRIVLLSVEPRGTQSRRVRVFQGSLPPKFAPDRLSRIRVDGLWLKTKEEEEQDASIPF